MHFDLLQNIGGALIALLVVVVAGWFAIVRIRRWMRAEVDESKPFTLDDLRRLHREGKLSDEEFQRARDSMIAAVQRATKPAVKPGMKPGVKPEGGPALQPLNPGSMPPGAQSDPSVDFGIPPDGRFREAKRTHPPRPPKRPPQLGG